MSIQTKGQQVSLPFPGDVVSQATVSAARIVAEGRKCVVSYGGGVNSVAVLVQLARLGIVPAAIVMADPGSERRGTVVFRDEILPAWLDQQGFPRVAVITRIEEGQHVKRAWRLETLYDECIRIGSLPSVAYGWKKCSANTRATHNGGGRLVKYSPSKSGPPVASS